ncbi:XRE family transcriptional regulator [Pluralibacter gergoviae]|uniref:helix-turn-helix domain-containing protein n=1 Tax=Pluralibacter gergoviae TaxID=61647 RepID=UPI0004F7E082|nr:XRE family transcriptional regulator [Pluralibacter gergoviae]AIQ99364.1 XRE family transcriptional regulator [Pluralibacter gergoviae]
MKQMTDGKIAHITPADGNIFADLGFAPDEAQQLKQQAEREAAQLLNLKRQLMNEISGWIDEHHLKQAEVARRLHISRPRVSDVVNQKTSKFTLDALVLMLARLGKPVTLQVG